MRSLGLIVMAFVLFFSVGCASTAARLPASFKSDYNRKIVASLSLAAMNHVLFNVDDSVFRDVSSRQIDMCRAREMPTWSNAFLNFLALMDKHPELYDKFNLVEFKSGGSEPSVEINKDIDGLSSLTIAYGKKEEFEKVTAATKMPCPESAAEYFNKDLTVTTISWPKTADIHAVLEKAQPRSQVERFKFKTDFLMFLAERQTILKINPEVAFEQHFNEGYFLASWLESMAAQLRNPKVQYDYLNYWLGEISTRSSQAKSIQFFGLHGDNGASVGVKVDSAGKLKRKMNNYQEPTYIFMSYRQQNGAYHFGTIKDLESCLRGLTGVYRNPLSMGSALERESASFLAPGHSCVLKEPENP